MGIAEERNADGAWAQNAGVVSPFEFDALDSAHILTADIQKEVILAVGQSYGSPKQKKKQTNKNNQASQRISQEFPEIFQRAYRNL